MEDGSSNIGSHTIVVFVPGVGERGDVNGDGIINIVDVVVLVNHILSIAPLAGDALFRADCTEDGNVNVVDAICIVNLILGPADRSAEIGELSSAALRHLESLADYMSRRDFARFMALVRAETGVPTQFGLAQNYPNPFNPMTSIQYSVVSEQSPPHITLKIYNTLGQAVRTLVDEAKEAGYYTVTWDGRDGFGQELSSGVYFYRFTVGHFTATRRMVLMK